MSSMLNSDNHLISGDFMAITDSYIVVSNGLKHFVEVSERCVAVVGAARD